ncbi:MAG: hypothetical protein HBSAPP02_22140 [Phycisphaerae bacterium]|nr:MAG: hypothetical protein HBSAPP02_22140 [Phycisphaerae bacterium]
MTGAGLTRAVWQGFTVRRRVTGALVGLGVSGLMGCVARPCVQSARVPTIDGSAGVGAAAIDSFSGEYRYLSNFWLAAVTYEGKRYPSVEHAYQAAKTLDVGERARIAGLATASEAKRAGRGLRVRVDWEQVKLGVMEQCVRDKFLNHADLGAKLLATGEAELVEGNDWGDRFWGVCEGRGENHLGKILMKVRSELRRGKGGG